MLKASTYFQSGRYKKAIEDCDEVLKRLEFSGNKERSLGLWLPDIYYEIIYNYWNDPIDHTLNNPDKHRMLIIQGESYEKLGKKKNAKDCYSKALEINPNNRYLKARIEKLNNKEISDNNDLYKLANTYCPYCSGKLISKPDYCNHCGRKLSRTIKNGVEVVEQYKQDQYEKEINHNGKLETRWFGDLSILSIIGLVLGYIISYIFFSIVTPFYISGLKYFFLIPVIVPIFEIVGSAIEKKKIPFYFYIGNTIEMFIIYILFFMGYLSIFVTEKTIYDFLFSAELLKIIIPIIFISLIHYIIAGVIRLRRKLNIDELEVIAAYCFPLEIAIIILPLIFGFQVNI